MSDPEIPNVYAVASHGWMNRDDSGDTSQMSGIWCEIEAEIMYTLDLKHNQIIFEASDEGQQIVWSKSVYHCNWT